MLVELAPKKEEIPREALFKEKGFAQFVSLLRKEEEASFLNSIQKFALEHVADKFRSYPLLLNPYRVEISSVPPQFLPIVCAKTTEGKIELTPFGETIKIIYHKMAELGIEGYFILAPGGALEAVPGAKPFSKTRTSKDGSVAIEKYEGTSHPPVMDGDLIMVVKTQLTEETIESLFPENITGQLQVKSYSSNSRKTIRMEIGHLVNGKDWRKFWFSSGQISILDPMFSKRIYHSLVELVLARDTNDRYILLTPTNTSEGFIGTVIDFFPSWRQISRVSFLQRNCEGKITRRTLKPAVIPSLDLAFPIEQSFPESFAVFMHLIRSCPWENCFPIINETTFGITPSEKLTAEEMQLLALATSLKFAETIVYPLTKNPSLIIQDFSSMRETTTRILHSFRKALDGDPYLGLNYFLSAGENHGPYPVFGMGFIDPKGPLPYLYEFLQYQKRIERLLATMEACDFGAALKGWSTFISFLYRETSYNLPSVVKLLTPTFCSQRDFPSLVENYIRRSLENIPDVGMKPFFKDYLPSWSAEPCCF